jgi:hypothetical protein
MRNTLSLLSGTPNSIFTARGRFLNPASLFTSGEDGAWYDTSDISVLFQDTAGTTPITASGQTIARVNDKSGNGLNATQATTAARPSYIVDADGAFIQHDPVDDALTVTLPDLGAEATVAYVTRSEVRLLEDQTISGSYTLPAQELANFVVIDRALTFAEKVSLIRFLASKVEGVNYGAEIDRLTLIAINAVDVFVYDTSKDSDGGAWRTGALAQASSWYNETLNTATRGSRREFPAVAVIVAEADKVTIYDGDDPTLPMWMVFTRGFKYSIHNAAAITSISMLNGELRVGEAGSGIGNLSEISFLADKSGMRINSTVYYYIRSALSQRNTSVSTEGTIAAWLVNRDINDVAMTVLPDAPIDPATGLPVPTIYVFTAGGVSRIADDGTVSSTASTAVPEGGIFDDQVWATFVSGGQTYFGSLPVEDTLPTGGALNAPYYWRTGKTNTYDLFTNGTSPSIANDAFGLSTGLHRFSYNAVDNSASMLAITTSTYNTGWMPGDTKLAALSDTDDTDLVGSGELVTNGTFDTDTDWTKGAGWTISAGVASFDTSVSGAGVETALTQNITTVVGKLYIVKATFSSLINVTGSELLVRCAGTNLIAWETGSANILTDGTYTFSFVANSTTTQVNIRATVLVEGNETGSVDNVSVKLADEDRSVNNNGLIINGTITRTFVDEV